MTLREPMMTHQYGNGQVSFLDPSLHLFIDDDEIRNTVRISRYWGQPRKRPEPVLKAEQPHEGLRVQVGAVLYDEQSSKFRCWYFVQYSQRSPDRMEAVCYAESDDGIHWEKPALGLYEFDGSSANNICLRGNAMSPVDCICGCQVLRDDNDPDPNRRYKLFTFMQNIRMYEQPELWAINHYLFCSPDGIHFPPVGEKLSLNSASDRAMLMRDERRGLWVAMVGPGGYSETGTERRVALIESEDMKRWSDQIVPFKFRPDEGDGSIHDHHSMYLYPYGNQYIGLFDRYCKPSYVLQNQIVTSRDGRRWNRPPDNRQFLPAGALEDFDSYWVLNSPNRPIPVGDDLYFYYQGGSFHRGPANSLTMSMGLATLRRDGFCGLISNAKHSSGPGIIRTEPVEVTAPVLQLNADIFGGEGIRVGVLDGADPHSPGIEGMNLKDCVPVTDAAIRAPVRWNSHANLADLVGRKVVLLFEFNNAVLFAYKFARDE